ncbi:family 78 glycoside hydrolase catalytic domain [Streptomyces sp. NPDC059349]|uniref:family 78 glycoside hydrolase catalytic domain n=1 Tax=Streptomyces sp. NPDC059349 TaxID=3346808 RepID=UPI003684BB7B
MRSSRFTTTIALATTLGLAASGVAAASPHPGPEAVRVVDLRTDNKSNPIGIDSQAPLLAWKLDAPEGGRTSGQRAYEIRAAHSVAQLRRGIADVWKSGKVDSSATNNIAFAGDALRSRESVAWQVRVWDADGHASGWSSPATWEMGLLDNSDWSARWIENASYDYTRPDGSETPLPVFGKSFTVHGRVAKARLYMTGLGMYASTLNGRAVSANVLEPGQTTYSSEVDYRTYDLTDELKTGTNVLGVETGSGAYQRVKTPGHYFFGGNLEQYTVYGEPKAIAQLEITYADGRKETVKSDTSWRTALGPTTYSSWWSGEEFDARRSATSPTAAVKLSGSDWQNASLAKLTSSTTPRDTTPLRADQRPPVTVAQTVEPVSITSRGNGSYILDFGANRSGWPTLNASGPAGSTITMTPAELLKSDGSLDVSSTGATATNKIAYRYTMSGKGTETWHPQFTYSGFRYLQVDGLPAAPRPDTVTMKVVHASNPPASTFDSSSELINGIHTITLRAMQSNMMSVLTDCPDREKGPYTGDNLHNLDALLTDYDLSSYEPQLVRNMATAQRQPGDASPGLIANIAPEFHRVAPIKLEYPQGTIEFLDEVNWGSAVIRIPWQLYRTYGDTRTMTLYYDNMVKWLDYEAANKAANKGDIPGLGDWSATDNTTPMQLAILAGYYTAANDMAKTAKVLGKSADVTKYTALAAQLADEFTSKFRHEDSTGVYYGSDSEASDAMALDAGLVAASDRAQVLARLVASVRASDNHITTGSVGLGPLFRALQDGGRDDVIYDMVVNPTSPGYGYLVASGHTTLPESLDGSGSQNHHFLGQVDSWLISGLAGIRQASGSVAYRQLDIAPAVVGNLTHASGSYATPQGDVSSAWQKDHNGRLTLKVTVPTGSTATVHVPAASKDSLHVTGGHTAPSLLNRSATAATYQVAAGTYAFQVR